MLAMMVAAVLWSGNGLEIEGERTIDPARSVFLRVTLTTPANVRAVLPDLRERFRGFAVAEDFAEPVKTAADGSRVETVNWRLVPEPCAAEYRLAPFAVHASPAMLASQADDGRFSFVAGPVRFDPPAAREPVTGGMEADPKKDFPPLTPRFLGRLALIAGAFAAAAALLWFGVKRLLGRIREHRMSPIERAWVELDRLLRKGLPGRGRYKDFYVELTMVVRRYVQRKYGIRAPHLTTEEFLKQLGESGILGAGRKASIREFLESADMVKFAGVQATPEMADAATDSARGYLSGDAAEVAR